jgi:ABC-type uncharacterized transport system auxiliary subunit
MHCYRQFIDHANMIVNRLKTSHRVLEPRSTAVQGNVGAQSFARISSLALLGPTKSSARCSYPLRAACSLRGANMLHRNLLKIVCLTASLASLAGCAGKIRYPNYFVLNLPVPPPVTSRPKPVPGSVGIREFGAPAFLRTGAIVYRLSPEQLGFYRYDRWAADPRSTVTQALIQNMQARGFFDSVRLFDGRGTSDYLVTGMLEGLEEVDNGENLSVKVGLSAQLMNMRTGDVLWRDTASETRKVEHHSKAGIVAEMSKATESAVEQLTSSMQNRVVSAPTAFMDR